MKKTFITVAVIILVQPKSAELKVTNIQAIHRNGQTFVTWKDVAEGEAGADFRYSLCCSDQPIIETGLADVKPVIHDIVNNSAKHYGYHMFQQRRRDPNLPMATIEPDGEPLPQWTGLAVRTVEKAGAR